MLIIPTSQVEEWEAEYNRLQLNKQISLVSFLTHCAATWGYGQGLTAMNNLFNIDPEWQ
jgi:hypothetical protein